MAIVTRPSRGIEKAIALELGKTGCRVVINYASSSGAADEVVGQIKSEGGEAVAIQADCSKFEDVEKLFKETSTAFDGDMPSILVHNAGITRDELMLKMTPNWLLLHLC